MTSEERSFYLKQLSEILKVFFDHGYKIILNNNLQSTPYVGKSIILNSLDEALNFLSTNSNLYLDKIIDLLSVSANPLTCANPLTLLFPFKFDEDDIHPFFLDNDNLKSFQEKHIHLIGSILHHYFWHSSENNCSYLKLVEFFEYFEKALRLNINGWIPKDELSKIPMMLDSNLDNWEQDFIGDIGIFRKENAEKFLRKTLNFVENFERSVITPNAKVLKRTISNTDGLALNLYGCKSSTYTPTYTLKDSIGRIDSVQVKWKVCDFKCKEKKLLDLMKSYLNSKLNANGLNNMFCEYFYKSGNELCVSPNTTSNKNPKDYIVMIFPFGNYDAIGSTANSLEDFIPEM